MKSKEIKATESLLEKMWNRDRKNSILYIIISFPTIFFFIITILVYKQRKRDFYGIKGLRDAGKDYTLKDIASKIIIYWDQEIRHIYAIYALADLDCNNCALIIYRLYSTPRPINIYEVERVKHSTGITFKYPSIYKIALLHIAEKRGVSFNELIDFLDKEYKKTQIKTLQEQIQPKTELTIPITKTYLLDAGQKNEKDMITKLPLDFKNNDIVACPNCGNMSEINLMTKWLKEKNVCPICKKMIDISDCPLVIIRTKGK